MHKLLHVLFYLVCADISTFCMCSKIFMYSSVIVYEYIGIHVFSYLFVLGLVTWAMQILWSIL